MNSLHSLMEESGRRRGNPFAELNTSQKIAPRRSVNVTRAFLSCVSGFVNGGSAGPLDALRSGVPWWVWVVKKDGGFHEIQHRGDNRGYVSCVTHRLTDSCVRSFGEAIWTYSKSMCFIRSHQGEDECSSIHLLFRQFYIRGRGVLLNAEAEHRHISFYYCVFVSFHCVLLFNWRGKNVMVHEFFFFCLPDLSKILRCSPSCGLLWSRITSERFWRAVVGLVPMGPIYTVCCIWRYLYHKSLSKSLGRFVGVHAINALDVNFHCNSYCHDTNSIRTKTGSCHSKLTLHDITNEPLHLSLWLARWLKMNRNNSNCFAVSHESHNQSITSKPMMNCCGNRRAGYYHLHIVK